MSSNHPYKSLEKTKAWKAVEKALKDLVENGDLEELTAREYLVGYILEQMKTANLLAAAPGVAKESNGTHIRGRAQAIHP